jgi:LacI family transcriptional regulator
LATEHLLACGHRRIAFLGGRTGSVFNQRLQGYKAALQHAGISDDRLLVFPADPTRTGGVEATLALLDTQPGVSAAVCYSDVIAFGALSALGDRGRRAGVDFALLGFDNVHDTAHANPPLSTIDIHPRKLGECAARMLLARIGEPNRPREWHLEEPSLLYGNPDKEGGIIWAMSLATRQKGRAC